MDAHIFFDSWGKIGRTLLLAAFAYGALVVLLRLSGKRTLSKLNVFDFVFVVALGDVLASTILTQDNTLADGLAAFVALIALQLLLSWLCVSSDAVDRWVNGEPTLLLHKGKFLMDAMKRQRVTKEEILAAIREEGLATKSAVDSVVLETDGKYSIVWQKTGEDDSSMTDVKEHPGYIPEKERETAHS